MALLARILDPAIHARLTDAQQSVLISHLALALNVDADFVRMNAARERKMQDAAKEIITKMKINL